MLAAVLTRFHPMLSVLVVATALGCAAPEPPRVPPPSPAAPAHGSSEVPAPPARPELSADEQVLARRLATHVERLSGIGERHPGKPWELADAADYIATTFEGMGYVVERQGYELDAVLAQNLLVTVGGGEAGEQLILVGAHYDSPPGDAGENAGASGVAAVLELARLMQGAKLTRTLRFCAFALGESPLGDGPARGSRVYHAALAQKRAREEGKRAVEADAKRQGTLPQSLPELPMDSSRFIAAIYLDRLLQFRTSTLGGAATLEVRLTSNAEAGSVRQALQAALSDSPVTVSSAAADPVAPDSDLKASSEASVPTVEVRGEGTEAAVDLDGLARVVMRVRGALGELAREKPPENALVVP